MGVRETTYEEAIQKCNENAKESKKIHWLYQDNRGWFVSFRQWNDWLLESHPDGNSFFSEAGLRLAMKLNVAPDIPVTGHKIGR